MTNSKLNKYFQNRVKINMLPMWPRISAYAGIMISILVIGASIYCTPHFVANHLSSDGIITESGTILMINGYRLSMALIGISMLLIGMFRPDFIYSATNVIVQRSLKERTEQITHKTDAFSIKVLSILFCVIVLGSFLRLYGLDKQSLWNDEVASEIYSNQKNLTDVINKGVRPDVHPPGFHILIYFVEKYLGNSESALRLPSAISGILSIFVIFLLGARLYSYKEGLISSILTALLWCPIYYSQEARAYSLLILFTLLATYFWIFIIKALNEESKLPFHLILGYILSSIISCYLHYFGLYFIALQGLFTLLYFLYKRKKLIQIISLYFIIGSSYIPFLPIFWEQLHKKASWISKPTSMAFIYYLKFLFNDSFVLLSIVIILFMILLYINIIIFFRLGKDKTQRTLILSSDVFLLLWLVIPFAGIFIKSIISFSIFTYRNLLISLPAAYLLLSRSITQFHLSFKKLSASCLVISCFLLFQLIFLMNYYSKPNKDQFREAAGYIVEKDPSYKDSLIVGWAWSRSYFDYYFQRMGFKRKVDILAGEKNDISLLNNEIRLKCPKYIWYITARRVPNHAFINLLSKELMLVDQKKFLGAKVWLFKNKIFCNSQ